MDTTPVDLSHLFEQLGLESSDKAISQFIDKHTIGADLAIWQADFWTPAQAGFLRESLEVDANWSELIDLLDTRLRK
ncbi:DUF2789 domain-containing protein [Shewanella litorisediminis]|uniref:DUF2789 domain-containing protein n=1 Tax=Shewanella litorisediminis TaxID=1173586 RepID=A0ABX7G672_9GAMM|nr:DUF2789 domain-containing protein [Shewanella litorisediminis]MCL2916975.1 DUF2789 domain-containing protein [Shewanella litorisediminis]QRH02867.1 DUF2789 domain-containing protein [Shewanella litorisediminis]